LECHFAKVDSFAISSPQEFLIKAPRRRRLPFPAHHRAPPSAKIAADCGFTDQSSFTQPNRYRTPTDESQASARFDSSARRHAFR
jgi:hypothetical protein